MTYRSSGAKRSTLWLASNTGSTPLCPGEILQTTALSALTDLRWDNDRAHDKFCACSSEELVQEVQAHFLRALRPLSRPAVEHDVELPGVLDDLIMQLREYKVSYLH